MDNKVNLIVQKHLFQLMRPQTLCAEIMQCGDLVLVAHSAYCLDLIVVLRRGLFHHVYYEMCLRHSQCAFSCADIDHSSS